MNKTLRKLTLVAAVLATVTLSRPATATVYPDATGETAYNVILDISSVEISNDPTDVIFKINVVGDIIATDWGNYMIGIKTTGTGDTNGNGWGRPIKVTSGINYWLGTWANNGNGAEVRNWDGAAWQLQNATWGTPGGLSITKSQYSLTVRYPFASLGLSTNGGNNTFDFDVYSSGGGGGDSAIDALSRATQSVANWGDPFTTTNTLTYTILPVDNTPTNKVFFSVDMQVPMYIYDNSPPAGFDEGSDLLYVSGSFNGWSATAPFQLFQVGTSTVFTNTVDVIANLNDTIQYKFRGVGFFNDFESPYTTCGGDRTLVITNANMSAPAVYWNDSSLADPTNTVTFQVDMLFPTAVPPGTNVYVRGSFNDWGNTQPALLLTNIPSTTIWVGTLELPYFPTNGCKPIQYKFVNGTTYESGNNRSVNITTLNPVLAATFSNVELCDVVAETNFVTFTVNMTNAVGTDALVYDGTQAVYLNGGFAGWWGWGNTNDAATNYLMTLNPGTSNYSLTLPFAPGSVLRLVYKYSMNGLDNEGGFGQDHVRYIRTTPGQTSYTLPLDNWTGTVPANIANLQEPKFGLLKAVPTGPGQVSVEWLGLKCVQLQGSTNLATPGWTSYPATDGASSTNWPATTSQGYFRLIDTSP